MQQAGMRRGIEVLFCLVLTGLCSAATPNWPTWRGPDMMGISEGNPPLTWSETDNIKWKVDLEGDPSNSTPIVWDDKLIFQAAVITDRKPAGAAAGEGGRGRTPSTLVEYRVVCLDRNTGKTLWNKKVCEAVPHEGHHGDTGFASFSPVTDGTAVWAGFGSRGIYCLTLDGEVKWQKEMPPLQIRASFGEGNSPLLAEGKLFVVADHEGDSFILALDKNTGDVVWRKDRDERTSWASPVAVTVNGKTHIVTSATSRIRSYDSATGEILWECSGQTENVIPTPVAGDGMIYCTSGFRGAKLTAIKPGQNGDLTGTDAIVWEVNEATPYVPSPLLYGGKVYVLSVNNAVVSCYNAKTGAPYYTKQAMGELKNVYASPLGAAGRVYFVGRNGVTCVLDNTSDAFKVLAVNRLDANIDASPVVVGDTLYLKGKKALYCIAKTK